MLANIPSEITAKRNENAQGNNLEGQPGNHYVDSSVGQRRVIARRISQSPAGCL